MILASLLLAGGCRANEVVLEPFRGETPRERYEEALDRAGLRGSAMTREWHAAGIRALSRPVGVASPMLEEAWFPLDRPMALGYLIEAERGQRIEVRVQAEDAVSRMFLELHRLREQRGEESGTLVTWAEEWERDVVYEVTAAGRFVAVVQPELLAGGAVEVSIQVGPSLAFPVDGGSMDDIGSVFGDIRDGGARDHHGVDIFAARGTPVLAAAPGEVYRVETTGLGGKVVWVRDPRTQARQYYAHLDTQMVRRGQEVRIGDVLGLVGNTGNAIRTPPHLHFGVYVRRGGPVDPHYFVYDPGGSPAQIAVDREAFARTLRVGAPGTPLRAAPSVRSPTSLALAPHVPVEVLGGSGDWYRVALPTGETGYVLGAALEGAESPLEESMALRARELLRAPIEGADRVRRTGPGEVLAVHGRLGSWAWVAGEANTPPGWLYEAVE